jgi:HAD superfamily hydrolase (TIGR01549 family)
MLKYYGRLELSRDFYIRELWGLKSGTRFKGIEDLSDSEISEMTDYYHAMRDRNIDETKVFPHVFKVLTSLREKRLKLGLVTSTYRDRALAILERFSLISFFDVVVGGDEVEPKPSPEPILLACKKLQLQPHDVLYIGDTMADIEAGISSGCTTAIVATSRSYEELAMIDGIIPLKDLTYVLKLIK